jgi:hypothetical protein
VALMKKKDDRMEKATARFGDSKSKGSKPSPKAKITFRPTGGLKPDGFKIKWKKEF